MSVYWIPGIGNVDTPDNPRDLPPGSRLVSGPSAPSTPPVTVTPTIIINNPPSSGGGSYDSGRESRIKEKQQSSGWDNIPEARALQNEWWDIYIETGTTNSPRQLELNKRAENIRKAENPMYSGRPGTGPIDQADANKIALPTNQFPTSSGLEGLINYGKSPQGSSNIMGIGILAIMAVAVISFVKG